MDRSYFSLYVKQTLDTSDLASLNVLICLLRKKENVKAFIDAGGWNFLWLIYSNNTELFKKHDNYTKYLSMIERILSCTKDDSLNQYGFHSQISYISKHGRTLGYRMSIS